MCKYPNECCMAHTEHSESECHTPDMVESSRSPDCYKSGAPITLSGQITSGEIHDWTKNNPEVAFMAMTGIMTGLGFSQEEIADIDVRRVEQARADL